MNVHVNRHGIPDVGIIYQRGLMQFWVPSTMQEHLPYNPRHLPTIIYDTTLRPMGIAIWRCFDGPDGDRYTKEVVWWSPQSNKELS